MTGAATERAWVPSYRPGLDGLRAVAVGLVVVYHVVRTANGPVLRGGFVGVDVFFVLSGFLITSLLLREHARTGTVALRRFYARRAWRLVPVLLVVAAVTAAYFALLPADEFTSAEVKQETLTGALMSVLYVASWGFALDGPMGVMGYTWSLSVEEHFYLVWPVAVLLLLRRRDLATLPRRVAVVTAVATAWPVVLLLGLGVSWNRLYAGPDTRASQLLAGCLLAVVMARPGGLGRWRVLASGRAATLSAVALLLAACVLERTSYAYWLGGQQVVTIAAVCLTAHLALRDDTRLARLLSWGPAVAVGLWSYSIYLWHRPFLVVFYPWLGETSAARALGAAVSVVVAVAGFRWVEQPLLRRATGRAARPESPETTPAPPRRFAESPR
jgi:peptidoglycan/LPS O-acetylase OafA/YrhL